MKTLTAIVIAMLLLVVSTTTSAQTRRQEVRPSRIDKDKLSEALLPAVRRRLDSALNAQLKTFQGLRHADGMVVGIVRGGKIVHLGAYGFTDRSQKRRLTIKDPVGWASVGKLLTAVATHQLIDRYPSEFGLDTRVGSLISDGWASRGYKDRGLKLAITIDQLLRHRSGIRHYTGKNGDPKGVKKSGWKAHYGKVRTIGKPTWNAMASIGFYKDLDLAFNPGTDFRYSSFGSALLGAAIDRFLKSKKGRINGYHDWVIEEIGKKAGMSSLSVNSEYRYLLPGGGWKSNIADKTKFAAALLNDKLVPILDLCTPDPRSSNEYGRGMRLFNRNGNLWVGHTGSQTEVRSALVILAERGAGGDPNLPSGPQRLKVHPNKTAIAVVILRRPNRDISALSVVDTVSGIIR